MAIAWLLAIDAAVSALTKAAVSDLYKTSKEKVGAVFSDGPVARPLRKAFQEGLNGFRDSLAASFPMDVDTENGLEAMARHDDFAAALGQLPLIPFPQLDTTRLRELFVALGPKGADEGDFQSAWKALGRRFTLAAAESSELKSLIELSYAARQEAREEVKQEKLTSIELLLDRLVKAAEAQGRTPDDEPLVRKYRTALYERYRYADTRGLFMREKEGVAEGIELRDVFVETSLIRLIDEKAKKKQEKREESSIRGGEDEDRLSSSGPLRFGEVISRDRLTVVLGAPGSGKSTLVRCLALSLCRPADVGTLLEQGFPAETVPVLLNLKEFASALQQASNLELDRFLLERNESELPNLETLLEQGRALVLLDGLDEVFDESHRRWVSDEVWRLMSRFPVARFVLTSRPHGYRAAPLPGPVTRWRLQPFEDEQIGLFFVGWFVALAREGAEAGAAESPQARAEALTREVLARSRLKEMAQNPLLCTLIVLVHRSRSGQLPQRRVVFYEAAVRTLVEVWERTKHYPIQKAGERYEFPEPEILIRAMAEIAWRAFHQLGSREIPGELLRKWFRAYMERETEWRGDRGDRAVRDLLRLVGDRTGLLTDLGGDQYQFVHLSLHEWLVSFFLLDRLSEAQRLEVMRYYVHSPEWEEALRLLVAGAPQAQSDILVQDLLEKKTSEFEGILRRDLRFVCRCFGDLAPLGPRVRARIEAELKVAFSNEDVEDLEGLFGDVEALDGSNKLTGVIQEFLHSPIPNRRRLAIRFLPRVSPYDSSMRELLLARLGDEDLLVRRSAVEFFMRHSMDGSSVRESMLARLGDEDPLVLSFAQEFFAAQGVVDSSTRELLLARLRDGALSMRRWVVEFFARHGANDSSTRELLLQRLEDEDPVVRRWAEEFFARHEGNDLSMRELMLTRLRDENPVVRRSAVEFFARRRAVDSATRDLLLARLEDEDPSVRSSAVEYFTQLGSDDSLVGGLLLARLKDEDPSVRSSAVEYFTQLGSDDSSTRELLLTRLGDDNPLVRGSAVEFFTRHGAADSLTWKSLLTSLKDEDSTVRSLAVRFFMRYGAADSSTRELLLASLKDEHFSVRSSAVDFFRCTDFSDEELGEIKEVLAAEADKHVLGSLLRLHLDVGLSQDFAAYFLDRYERFSDITSSDDDRRFSAEIGRLAATEPRIQRRLMEKGKAIRYFQFGSALRAMVEEEERLQRLAKPIQLPIPGCDDRDSLSLGCS